MIMVQNQTIAVALASAIRHEYHEFPAWFYGPDGQSEIFHSIDEVPEGWAETAKKARHVAGTTALTGVKVNDEGASRILADAFTQAELANHLAEMQAEDARVEFTPSWPKLKLAQVIVANGSAGPTKE